MSTARICLVVALLLIVVGGGALDWQQHMEINRLRAEAAKTFKPDEAEQRLTTALNRIDVLRAENAIRPAWAGGQAPEAANRRTSSEAFIARPILLPEKTGPTPEEKMELRKLASIETRASIDRGYAALFRELEKDLGFTPAQLESVKGVLLEMDQTVHELGDATDPYERIRQAMSGEAFARFQRYQETLPQRNLVELVNKTLDYDAQPMNDTQTEQLIKVLAQFSPPRPQSPGGAPSAGNSFNFSDDLGVITDEAIAAAASVLAPTQVQALQQVQLQQNTQRKLFLWMARLRQPTPPPGGSVP